MDVRRWEISLGRTSINDLDLAAAAATTIDRPSVTAPRALIRARRLPRGVRRKFARNHSMMGMTRFVALTVVGQRAVTVFVLVKNRTPSIPCWLASPNAERFQPPKV